MNFLESKNIRSLIVNAHVDAGKTTFTERVLYYTNKIHTMGEVHNGQATMDSDIREQKRGITINSAATFFEWNENIVFLVDSPGHDSFTFEVERAMRIADGGITLLDASQGVEPQTEQVWRQADKYNVARIIFINKMDKTGASFEMCFQSLKDKLGIIPLPIQVPYGEEDKFNGIIDIVNERMIEFTDPLGLKYSVHQTNPDFYEHHRQKLAETLADLDDKFCEEFLNEEANGDAAFLGPTSFKEAIRRVTIARKAFPVLCGSALRNKGVQMALDAVVDYLPAPSDLISVSGMEPKSGNIISRKLSSDEKFSALAFKIVSDKNGDLTYLRIYSGTLSSGSQVYNASKQKYERINRLYLMHANHREAIEQASAGMIVACVGLKNTITGDTLCDSKDPILLESVEFPEPVIELAVEPKTNSDQDKLSTAIGKLLLEDPSLKIALDDETGQTILRGMGELHLEIVVDKLRTDHKVDVKTGNPRVSYRETIMKEGFADYKHQKQSGGRGQYGHVILKIRPGQRGSGLIFTPEVIGGRIPKEYFPAIEKGVKGAMTKGIVAGFPITDVEVTLLDGSYHSVDSSSIAFEITGSMAFQQACKSASPVILEPMMFVEVVSPEQYMGEVLGSISSRSGHVKDAFMHGNARIVEALVPLRNLFGYITDLRGRTQGRASFSMRFSNYEYCDLDLKQIKG